jgi:hypothetical protein
MRLFWPVASINLVLAALYLASALWVTFNPASGCTVDGQPCASAGPLALALYIGAPVAALALVVLIGVRLRRHSPRVAVAWVAIPPLLLVAAIALSLLGLRG